MCKDKERYSLIVPKQDWYVGTRTTYFFKASSSATVSGIFLPRVSGNQGTKTIEIPAMIM